MQKITYNQFLSLLKEKWKQGQHISIVAPTGSGKTVAARDIIAIRNYLVVIATKRQDKSLEKYKLKKIKTWPPDWKDKRVLYWIKPNQLGDFNNQVIGIYFVLSSIYESGGWCIYFDDMFYVANTLGLKKVIQMLYTQARSENISLVASLQRPRNVPVEVINQSTYILIFSTRDKLDIERIAEEMSLDKDELLRALSEIQQYEFVFCEMNKAPIIVEKAQA